MENPLEFSKRSRRALFAFVIFLIIVVLIPRFVFLFHEPEIIEFSQTEFQKNKLKKFLSRPKKTYRKYDKEDKFKRPKHKFDPNTYAPSDWMELGLSEKQAAIMVSYGKHGYYSHEDLKKVFVVSDHFFKLIQDSLYYPEKPKYASKNEAIKPKTIQIIEINSANEEQLLTLKGIGPFFAKNIIKKREELGGFINKEQLLEVWKMDLEKLKLIESLIEINPDLIRKININSVTAEELKTHPYFTWNIANSIVKLRQQLGSYQQIEDLKKSKLIDDAFFNKIKPYLTL